MAVSVGRIAHMQYFYCYPCRAGRYTAVMDTFKLPMSSDPSIYPGQSGRFTLRGDLIGTQLAMTMNYNCLQQNSGTGAPFAGRVRSRLLVSTVNSSSIRIVTLYATTRRTPISTLPATVSSTVHSNYAIAMDSTRYVKTAILTKANLVR